MTSSTSSTTSTTFVPVVSTTSSSTSTTGSATSTSSSTTATVTAPAPVTTNPIDDAERSLSATTNLSDLWKKNVTDSSWLFKIFGLISYHWNKSTAETADATAIQYTAKLVALVTALGGRALTPVEAATVGVAGVQFNAGADQMKSAERLLAARTAEKEFYEVFSKRCEQLTIKPESNDFGIYTQAAMNGLTKQVDSMDAAGKVGYKETLKVKLGTAITGFGERIYVDMVKSFADQSADKITIQSFTQKAKDINGFFPANDIVSIEASMRETIRLKHTTAFTDLSNAYSTAGNNPKVVEIEKDLKIALDAQKSALDAELLTLRGPDNWHGAIHSADEKVKAAQIALNGAKTEFLNKFKATYGVIDITSSFETLIGFDFAPKPELQALKAEVSNKHKELGDAQAEHKALVDRLGVLAQFNGSTIQAGQYAEVQAKLANVGNLARLEATNRGKFYKLMTMQVGEQNKQVLHEQLHREVKA